MKKTKGDLIEPLGNLSHDQRLGVEVTLTLYGALASLETLPAVMQQAVLDQLVADTAGWHSPPTTIIKEIRSWLKD